jgi:hypothetical protein
MQVLVGRMHPLEVVQRAHRLAVILLAIVGEANLEFRVFGVGAERKLIDEMLIVLDRVVVIALGEHQFALRVVVLDRRGLVETATSRDGRAEGQKNDPIAPHRRMR